MNEILNFKERDYFFDIETSQDIITCISLINDDDEVTYFFGAFPFNLYKRNLRSVRGTERCRQGYKLLFSDNLSGGYIKIFFQTEKQ